MTPAPPAPDLLRRPRPRRHPAVDQGPVLTAGDWAGMGAILLVRADNLGDVVMTGPAVRAVRAAAPHARIDLLCSPAGAAIAPLLPGLDDLLVASPVWQDASPAEADPARTAQRARASFESLVAEVAGRRYDAMVVLTSFSQSPLPPALVGLLAEIPVRAGLSRDFGGGVLTHPVSPPDYLTHQVDRQLFLLASLGVPCESRELQLAVPGQAQLQLERELRSRGVTLGATTVAVAPGASAPARRWAPERFRRSVAALSEHACVVVVGSAKEQPLLDDVAGDAAAVLAGLPIPAWVALLARVDVAVVNNSGGLHVADALGTPVVVTWGGTEPIEHMAPRDVPANLLRVPTSCSPCHQFRCPYGDTACLDVPVGEVVEATLAHLARGAASRDELPREDRVWTA